MFSAQHGKEKKERMAKKGDEGKTKKEGLCSPLERRADVDVDVKEGGKKNESKARQEQAKAKARIFLPRISVLWLSHGHGSLFPSRAPAA